MAGTMCPHCWAPTRKRTTSEWRRHFLWSATWRLSVGFMLAPVALPLAIILIGIPLAIPTLWLLGRGFTDGVRVVTPIPRRLAEGQVRHCTKCRRLWAPKPPTLVGHVRGRRA